MNNRRAFFAIFLAALALGIFPQRAHAAVPSIQLFNNTQYPVDVLNPKSGRMMDILAPAERKIFAYRNGLMIRTADGRILHYSTVPVPREYGRGGLLSLTFNAQLNSDFSISLLPPLARPPALQSFRQPPGFPLRPEPYR